MVATGPAAVEIGNGRWLQRLRRWLMPDYNRKAATLPLLDIHLR